MVFLGAQHHSVFLGIFREGGEWVTPFVFYNKIGGEILGFLLGQT